MAGIYAYDGEFDRQMKRVMQKMSAKDGRSTCMEKDELKRVLETLITRGDLRVEKGPKGGDVFVAGLAFPQTASASRRSSARMRSTSSASLCSTA